MGRAAWNSSVVASWWMCGIRTILHETSLPGMKPKDIQDNAVTIRASTKREEKKTQKAGTYVRQERYEGEDVRTITLQGPLISSTSWRAKSTACDGTRVASQSRPRESRLGAGR